MSLKLVPTSQFKKDYKKRLFGASWGLVCLLA